MGANPNLLASTTLRRNTDPYGTVYTMGADGMLKTIQDRNNNLLTFTDRKSVV